MQADSGKSNAQRSEATRAALLAAARKLFVDKGFAESGTPEIVAAAKVTRGALYHHFADKADLLRAVLVGEAESVASAIAWQSQNDPKSALLDGAQRYFGAMAYPGRARLLLIEGPAILPRDQIDDINRRSGARELREGLAALPKAAERLPLDALADVLSAAFDAAALRIAEGGAPAEYLRAIECLLAGLDIESGA